MSDACAIPARTPWALVVLAWVLALAGCAVDSAPMGDEPTVGTQAPPRAIPPREPTEVGDPVPGLPSSGLDLPPLRLEVVVTLEAPIDTTVLQDGTLLVAERAGRILAVGAGGSTTLVLDVSDRTTTDGERGLLSIAVSPPGDELFLSMTDRDGDTLVEAYAIAGDTVVGVPRPIYTLRQPYANHNGGPLVFLPDGTLILGLGDGGGAGDPLGAGQDLATPLGSVIRLDVRDGGVTIPSDNPLVGVPGTAPEIAAWGLRNPWRMSYDGGRDELWIADVGQSAREEINLVSPRTLLGANFGWALREGSERFLGEEPEGHVAPVHDYAHGPGCSITGGVVYRGTSIPGLVGGYIFSDLCDGVLRVLTADGDRIGSEPIGVAGERIIGFGVDPDGELLVLEIGGRVLRLVPS